jgi:hypothetical protein
MIRLGLRENRTTFASGETIAGAVLWEFPERRTLIEVRLVWSTKGKGTEDGATVAVQAMNTSQAADTGTFSFAAPDAPYSFDGTLIALVWAVECVVEPGDEFQRIEIVIAPGGREIVLPKIEQPAKSNPFKTR